MQNENLIWNLFDEKHIDFDVQEKDDRIAAMEKFNPMRFYREHHVFRMGHFGGRIIELGEKVQLPTGSILHLLDDLEYTEHSDTPRTDTNIFIQRESFRKYIYHIRNFNLSDPIKVQEKYIYRQAGLPARLMEFRAKHGSEFRYINNVAELPRKNEALIVVNHNPLFRVKLMGRLQYYRKINLILTSLLNTVHQLAFMNKQQFVLIPWDEEVFDRQLFLRSRKELTFATIRRPDSFHYIFMMHLLNYMWDDAVTSIFDQLPQETLKQLNIVLYLNNKYIFYNLADIKALNEKNRAYYKFSNQLNLLSIAGRLEDIESPELKHEVEKTITVTNTEDKEESSVPDPENRFGVIEEEKEIVISEITTKEEIQDTVDKTESVADKVEETIKKVAAVAPKLKPVVSERTTVSSAIPNSTKEAAKSTDLDKNKVNRVLQSNTTAPSKEKNTIDKYAKEYMDFCDKETDDFIDRDETLTPKAKQRLKIVSRRYKDLEINGKRIEDILLQNNDLSVATHKIDKNKIAIVPDESSLNSNLHNFDKDYMEKTFHKHLASVITSFQKNGVFLIDVKEEKIVTEMNNVTRYTLRYEDMQGNKSSTKFEIPSVNKEGKILIDGVYQVLKKQRVNLPIVKLSDTEISLASNYNKTRIERNTNKAHSFFSFVDTIINTKKSNAILEYGNTKINLPISYEYCALAERYRRVEFPFGADKYLLYFGFENRLEHFDGDKSKLEMLEKEYGTYFGKNNKNLFFIDKDNKVWATTKDGSEDFEYPIKSMIELLKLSLKEGETISKVLTEWISIKILDAFLPVVYVLAYRYGLRHVLDYMGVKYTITERKNKSIVGESIPGTENFSAYHISGDIKTVQQYGLLSPRKLYNVDKDMFMQTVFTTYEERTKRFLNKSKVTAEDILNYLDNSPKRKPLNSNCIFWSFIPNSDMTYVDLYGTELSIDLNRLEKLSKTNPFLIEGTKITQISWKDLRNNYSNYINLAKTGANKDPNNTLNYKYIPHFAVEVDRIDFKELTIISSVSGMEDFNLGEKFKKWFKSIKNIFKEKAHVFVVTYTKVREIKKNHFVIKIDSIDHVEDDKRIPLSILKGKEYEMVKGKIKRISTDLAKSLKIDTNKYSMYIWALEKHVKGSESFDLLTPEMNSETFDIPDDIFDDEFFDYDDYEDEYDDGLDIDDFEDEEFIVGQEDTNSKRKWFQYRPLHRAVARLIQFNNNLTKFLISKLFKNKKFERKLWKISIVGKKINDKEYKIETIVLRFLQGPTKSFQKRLRKFDGKVIKRANSVFDGPVAEEIAKFLGVHVRNVMFASLKTVKDKLPNKLQKMQECSSEDLHEIQGKSTLYDITYIHMAEKKNLKKGYASEKGFGAESFGVSSDVVAGNGIDDIYGTDWIKIAGQEDMEETLISEEIKYKPQPNDIAIRFADRILWINRYPLQHSLIIAGLDYFDTSNYDLAEFESKDIYYQLLLDKRMSTNYLKGIDSFFDLFVDPMTYTVLKMMNEPTTVKDLLIRCAVLLSTTDHRPPSSRVNHRIRGYEQFNTIIYNEMSRQFAAYQSRRGKGNTFSVNPDAIFLRIIQNASMVPSESVNPLQDLKESAYMTYSGVGGRTSESFVVEDRRFAADDLGVISEATVDNQKVGINAQLSYDPGITNTMGMLEPEALNDLTPANLLSAHALVFPFSTNDDSKRIKTFQIRNSQYTTKQKEVVVYLKKK